MTHMIIVTRFSLLRTGGFAHRTKFDLALSRIQGGQRIARRFRPHSDEQIAAFLFSPRRMAERFDLFERVCIPSLRNQTDSAFRHVVVTSDLMPKRYMDRLKAIDGIEVRAIGKHDDILGPTTGITARLDDDDALGRDYVANVKKFATHGTCLSLGMGHILTISPEGATMAKTVSPFASAGLAYMPAKGETRDVHDLGDHTKVAGMAPCRLEPVPGSFCMTSHAGNDSHRFMVDPARKQKGTLDPDYLRQQYGIEAFWGAAHRAEPARRAA